MTSTRIREARETDCGDILRMIRVKTAGYQTECPGAGSRVVGGGELETGPGPLDAARRAAGPPSYPNAVLVLRL